MLNAPERCAAGRFLFQKCDADRLGDASPFFCKGQAALQDPYVPIP